MPDTTTIELRTDSVEQLVDVLESPHAFVKDKINCDRRKAIKARLEDQIPTQDAIALCGLPGAGKSTIADLLAEVYETEVISMGDAIREAAPDSLNSDQLGEYAAGWRQDDPKGIPEKVVEMAEDTDEELVIIDGVRSPTDHRVLEENFAEFHLIELKARFYNRLDRLQERGREGEEKFTATDLAERDERERYDLGFAKLKENKEPEIDFYTDIRPSPVNTIKQITLNNLPYGPPGKEAFNELSLE